MRLIGPLIALPRCLPDHVGVRLVAGDPVCRLRSRRRHEHDRRGDDVSAADRCRMGTARYGFDRTRRARRWDRNDSGRIARDLWRHGFQRECRAGCRDRSRQPLIAFAVAAILALAALQPTLIGVLTIMPRPVMAAAMLFTAVFIISAGCRSFRPACSTGVARWSLAWGCWRSSSSRFIRPRSPARRAGHSRW